MYVLETYCLITTKTSNMLKCIRKTHVFGNVDEFKQYSETFNTSNTLTKTLEHVTTNSTHIGKLQNFKNKYSKT